ncbi:MAG: protein kinase [Chlorobiaceae bacterium]|nr:protein kinase [Chlorobiaceae bacterium]
MRELLEKFDLLEINGYKFFTPLNGGMMSHSAIYEKNGNKAVVKFLLFPRNDKEVKRFEDEVKNINRVRTPESYSVKLLSDLIRHPQFPIYYFVSEYYNGSTLSEYLEKRLPLSIEKSINILRCCAIVLGDVNPLGVIHRDFHAGNIIILSEEEIAEGDPGIRLIDFGLSEDYIYRLFYSELSEEPLRHYGAISSWSPEYLNDPKGISTSHDIWALGNLFFRIVTGKWAFQSDSFGEYYQKVSDGAYDQKLLDEVTSERFVKHLVRRIFDIDGETRIKQGSIVHMCEDYINGTIAKLVNDKNLEELYYQYDGNIGMCLHCHEIVHPNGVICPKCGYKDDEFLPI